MTDPRLEQIVFSAVGRIQAAAQTAADKVIESLGFTLMSAPNNALRQAVVAAQFDLRAKSATFNHTFSRVLYEKVEKEIRPQNPGLSKASSLDNKTDWASLSLVEINEVEQRVSAERLSQELGQECEWELRDLMGYMSSLQGLSAADQERNPLRPQNIGQALFQAIQLTSETAEARKILAKELTRTLAADMRAVYQWVIDDIRQRGVQPLGMTVRVVSESRNGDLRARDGSHLGGGGPVLAISAQGPQGPLSGSDSRTLGESLPNQTIAHTLNTLFGLNLPEDAPASQSVPLSANSGFGGLPAFRPSEAGKLASNRANQASTASTSATVSPGTLADVIKRLALLNVQPDSPSDTLATSAAPLHAGFTSRVDSGHGTSPVLTSVSTGAGAVNTMADLATLGPADQQPSTAVNLIRHHRDELLHASSGALDHMIIDVVATLFDQVLADPKVPPQMGREIARLQLPVLKVALKDSKFFSSRKHPVRRFLNRIATLATSLDQFDAGFGQECLTRVSALIQEIIEGEFDHPDLYQQKLTELETFIRDQTALEAASHAEVSALLDGKEADLRIQQRYMRAIETQLAELNLPGFLADFLAQIWSQVQILACSREGSDSELAQRMHQVTRALINSIQPKSSPQIRSEFLIKLPTLMRDLNAGLELIRWPEAAKKEFFAKLLPAHAESLKAGPLTDFVQRQLNFRLEQLEKIKIPTREEVSTDSSPVPLTDASAGVAQLSDTEVQQAGFLDENAVDWSGTVDIDLTTAETDSAFQAAIQDIDINLDMPAPPVAGSQLMNHIQPGVAYQMFMNDTWKKVRLSWVSPGRNFFIFTYGRMYKQTVTVTSRTLAKLCEGQRFKAYENAELIERATARARKQLAALGSGITGNSSKTPVPSSA